MMVCRYYVCVSGRIFGTSSWVAPQENDTPVPTDNFVRDGSFFIIKNAG